jgi:hypothetical protein
MAEEPSAGWVLKYTVGTGKLMPIIVAEPAPQRALETVQAKLQLSAGEKLEIASPASPSLIKAFNLKLGQFTQW